MMSKYHAEDNIDEWLNTFTKKGVKIPNRFNECDYIIKRVPSYRLTYNKLKQKEELFQALFESSTDAVFIMKDDEFIDCNHKTLEIFSCTRDQIVGQTPYRFSPREQYDGSPSEVKAKDKIFTALSGKPLRFEWLHKRHTGESFDAQVTLSRFEVRKEEYLIAVVRDITECIRARRELLAREQQVNVITPIEIDSLDLFKITESMKKDRIFSDPNRFIIMMLLYYNININFTDLQDKTKLTPGNLGHHLKKLEEAGFVKTQKIISWRILTIISITDNGSKAFKNFADRMKALLYPIS